MSFHICQKLLLKFYLLDSLHPLLYCSVLCKQLYEGPESPLSLKEVEGLWCVHICKRLMT